jgi:nucleobase:cation symporter-1, NCS1 family
VALGLTADAVAAVFVALTLMLYLLVPWTALNLVDYFVVRRGRYAVTALLEPSAVYGTWNVRGLTAYGIGLLAEVPFMVLPDLFVGPVAAAMGGLDLAFVVGLVVAAAVHLALARGRDVAAEDEAVGSSDREPAPGS